MDKATIEAYLRMLGQELAVNNRTGSILLVGGAVMILVVGNRNSTRDIDASFEREAQAIRAAITDIAYREGLPLDWLNDGAKGFLYKTPPVTLWKSFPGLNVYMPSLDYLLSMKIVAGRPQDIADARALVQYLGVDQPQAIIDMLKKYIPPTYLTARVQYVIEDLLA